MTNIILLTVDALRRDHLGLYGYDRDTTPSLDEFGAESLVVNGTVSASSHTREAVPALLTGRYPDEAADSGYHLAEETVAGLLRESGYSTGAFHSNPFLSRAFGYGSDFEAFDDDLHLGDSKLLALGQRLIDKFRGRHYASAAKINERAIGWIDNIDEPFFLFNHYMDPHGPYNPPAKFDRFGTTSGHDPATLYRKAAVESPEAVAPQERQALIDSYDGEIAYVDDCIGRFLHAMEERELLENTLVIITADHGEAFDEHGYYGHPRHLDDELVEVPLILGGGSVNGNGDLGIASTLDVVPTILATIDSEAPDIPGRDLKAPAERDRIVFSQVRGEGEESNIRRFRATSSAGERLVDYDVRAAEVVKSHGRSEENLVSALSDHIESRVPVYRDGGRREDVTTAVEERIAALGYRD